MNARAERDAGYLGRAFGRGAEWRYFIVFVVGMLIPAAIAMAPLHGFFGGLFDTSTRSKELASSLDSSALTEVFRQLASPAGQPIGSSFFGVVLVTAFLAPFLAGAALVLARTGTPVDFRSLLGGAAGLYSRMLRMAVASSIPLGIAAGGSAAAFHFATKAGERALLESSADRAGHLATFASIVLFWLASAVVEAGRAHFAVDPDRRSALVALWSGTKLAVKRPLAVLGLSLVTTLVGVGGAAVVTAIRLRLPESGMGSITFALLVAQGAVLALAWGRSSKLVGLAELIRAENKV